MKLVKHQLNQQFTEARFRANITAWHINVLELSLESSSMHFTYSAVISSPSSSTNITKDFHIMHINCSNKTLKLQMLYVTFLIECKNTESPNKWLQFCCNEQKPYQCSWSLPLRNYQFRLRTNVCHKGKTQDKYEKKEHGNTEALQQSWIHKNLANKKTLQFRLSQKYAYKKQ